jgi:hypothetical protein
LIPHALIACGSSEKLVAGSNGMFTMPWVPGVAVLQRPHGTRPVPWIPLAKGNSKTLVETMQSNQKLLFRYTRSVLFRFAIAVLALAAFASAQSQSQPLRSSPMPHRATGTFNVQVAPLDPYNKDDKSLGRFSLNKQFHGALEGTSKGEMLSAGSPTSSGGAVAIEKVTGKLDGRSGTFVLQHSSFMNRGTPQNWNISVVPDSGTGELAGISGKMEIIIEGNRHSYVFDYTLPGKH